MLNKVNLEEVKEVLYHHYKTDDMFPRSCGSVSMALALMIQNSNLSNEHDVKYQRGHFRNDNEYDDCHCDIAEADFKRCNKLDDFECLNCTCDYMTGHSWVELINKNTNKITILDFTSIQFEEDFPEYQSEILESDFSLTKEELYDYIQKRSKFVVSKNEEKFDRYIPSERTYSGQYILEETKKTIKEDCVSSLTILLKQINYNI